MRKIAFTGGPLDGQTRVCRSHDTRARIVVSKSGVVDPFHDRMVYVYERPPFLGGEAPWPVPYRFVEERERPWAANR